MLTLPLPSQNKADEYVGDINETNPLGRGGTVARAFGEVLCGLWSGRHASVAPRLLKRVIGDAFPQFVGYQQQDSQELLSQLLDVLHEDLNRVVQKPYVERPDFDGEVDAEGEGDVAQRKRAREIEVAEQSWSGYLKRNNSVIIDLFGGLARNELTCPKCSKVKCFLPHS